MNQGGMMSPYRICLASPPDRERLVVEIFFEDVQWAEINHEKDAFEAEFYPRPDGQPWRIALSDVIRALDDAKRQLEI